METFRVRYLHGAQPAAAIQLVREFMGIGRREAKELIETRGVILERVSAAELRRLITRFAEIGAGVEVERTWRYVYAFDPNDPRRGDQPIEALRAGELELVIDHGQLGALEPGEPELFADEALTQGRIVAQLGAWTGAGRALGESEIAVLEALSAREHGLEADLREDPEAVEGHLIYSDWLQSRGDPRGQLIALSESPITAGLRVLELGDHPERRPAPPLARTWPHLHRLRKLSIHNDLPPLRALRSPTLEQLELYMRGLAYDFPERFVEGSLPALRSLTLGFVEASRVEPAMLIELLGSAALDRLRALTLSGLERLPYALVEGLGRIPRLARLARLDLSGCRVDALAMQALLEARERGRLPADTRLPLVALA